MAGIRIATLSQTATPMPAPAVQKPVNVPMVLLGGVVFGAIAGLLFNIVGPKLDRRMKMDKKQTIYGVIGGAVGGVAGGLTALLLKD